MILLGLKNIQVFVSTFVQIEFQRHTFILRENWKVLPQIRYGIENHKHKKKLLKKRNLFSNNFTASVLLQRCQECNIILFEDLYFNRERETL